MRIGWGEYYRPEEADQDLGDSVQWHARLQFIEAVDENSSIKDLMLDDTYPLFTLLVININHLAIGKKAQLILEGWTLRMPSKPSFHGKQSS